MSAMTTAPEKAHHAFDDFAIGVRRLLDVAEELLRHGKSADDFTRRRYFR